MKNQTFNDGIVNIYKIDNIAAQGNKPKEGLTLRVGPLRYQERIVGINRFVTAKQVNSKVQMLIRIPRVNISAEDIVILNDEQYKIYQLQTIQDVEPKVLDLSLEKVGVNYELSSV